MKMETRLQGLKTSTEKGGMDKKYLTFYEKFILQTKTLNDCRVSLNSDLRRRL